MSPCTGRVRLPRFTLFPALAYQGLVHLHALAIVHGDLKPANVLLDDAGRPRIADWGLSRISQGFTRTSTPATVAGFTEGYAAPEVRAGKRTSFASDMCVGVTFCRQLAGRDVLCMCAVAGMRSGAWWMMWSG